MNKKLMLLMPLLSGLSVVAMERTEDMSCVLEASHHEEKSLVKIRLTDAQNSDTTHEVAIPVRFAMLLGALNKDLVEDPELKNSVFPLPNVSLVQWRLIEPQLERVYGITHDAPQAAQLREAIMTDFRKLDVKSLVGIICAADYLEIPILLASACKVLEQSALDKISWEELEVSPWNIRNQIIMNKVLMLLGPVPARERAICGGHEDWVNSVCVTKDGKVVSGSYDGTVRVWDMQGNQLAVCRGHEDWVSEVCVTEDGKIVSGSNDKTVCVWDMEGNQLGVCRGHEGVLKSVFVMKDGKIVSGSVDNTVRVWDMEGNQLAICRGHERVVRSVCVMNDGKIVSGSDDEMVRIWDMQGNELAVCRGHEGSVLSVCVTQDGKIVSGSRDKTVRVWDMEGNQLAVCRGPAYSVISVCVTKEGKIVSGSYDETVRIWDIQGKKLAEYRGHVGLVTSVYATQYGKIVSGSRDRTVRIWDIEGNQLAECRGHEDVVRSVFVTSDGKIVSGSRDKTVRVWDISLLDRMRWIDEGHAQALWKFLQNISQQAEIDKQKWWSEIEKILGEDAPVAPANINNNNNE